MLSKSVVFVKKLGFLVFQAVNRGPQFVFDNPCQTKLIGKSRIETGTEVQFGRSLMLWPIGLVPIARGSFLNFDAEGIPQDGKLIRRCASVARSRGQYNLLAIREAPNLVFILTHEDAFMLVNKAMGFDFRIHSDRLPVGSVVPCDF
jgi:hypothetical protein